MPAPAERRTAMSMPPLSTGWVPMMWRAELTAGGLPAPRGGLVCVVVDAEGAAQAGQGVAQPEAERDEGDPEQERALLPPDPPGHQLPDRVAEAERDRGGDQEAVEGDQRHGASSVRCGPPRPGLPVSTRRTPRASTGTTPPRS